jgi:hypothetical protein
VADYRQSFSGRYGRSFTGTAPGAPGPPGVPQDGPGPYYVPATAGDFATLGIAAPAHLYLAQEASGNLADTIGGVALVANGTPLYQQAYAGWTRTFSGFNQSASQRFAAAAASGPNPLTTDVLWLGYMVLNTLPSGVRGVIAAGANVGVAIVASGSLRLSVAGVTVDDATTRPDTDDLAHPIALLYDNTNSRVCMYTDEAKTAGTYAAATDGLKGFGGNVIGATSPPASAGVFWGCCWTGADARLTDAQVKTRLQTLGWTIPWS